MRPKKPVEALTGEELWAMFFAIGSDPTHRELLQRMISVRRQIGVAVDLLQSISKDEDERARFRARRKFQMDMEHSLIVAQDEAMIRVAKNMLVDAEPIEKIMRYTGLTRDEVDKIQITV